DVRQRRARGLALIMLAHENAVASGKEPQWIGELYQEAFGASAKAIRKDAEALLPELGGVEAAAVAPAAKAKPAEVLVMPASDAAKEPGAPTASTAADAAPLNQKGAPPIGLSVGFGATSSEPGGLKP
ncbi:MAG TPA: hypothetical protein VFD26_06325, partial [Methyloceanibacter sp.]|nr:hypothetical protein [Methyloceanibacter sp.]